MEVDLAPGALLIYELYSVAKGVHGHSLHVFLSIFFSTAAVLEAVSLFGLKTTIISQNTFLYIHGLATGLVIVIVSV